MSFEDEVQLSSDDEVHAAHLPLPLLATPLFLVILIHSALDSVSTQNEGGGGQRVFGKMSVIPLTQNHTK